MFHFFIEDYSIYDADGWGFVTDAEKTTIGKFLAAFGQGIATRSIERTKLITTVSDLVFLVSAQVKPKVAEIDDYEI